ncbi:MAG: response regulator [Deltaproteobacteria bacterium]|nr:response regulator [Deltaproteobacteria bacterium]
MALKPTYEELIKRIEYLEAENERLKDMEDQRRQSHKMEALGNLTSGVAHDLNNILSGIVSYPDIILMDLPEESPLRKPVSTIKQSGEKAAVIVQDLLTLAGNVTPASQVLSLNDIIKDLKGSPQFQKIKRLHPDIKVVFELEMPLANITGSSVHILKSLLNLISNAAESIENQGKITVSTGNINIETPQNGYRQVIEKGNYIVLSIADTGAGISEKDLPRIFEPFYTKNEMGGSCTGLEMAVVWNIVKDHKGYIDIKTHEGRGTIFSIYFPVTESERTKKISPDNNTYKGSGETILVVDDVFEQREIACLLLDRLGYSVKSVSGGEEAVEYLNKNHADLVILDMIMDNGMDGLETFKKIIEIRPGQKIIIASGYSEADKVKEIQSLGCGAYVQKPYSMEQIGKAVRDELEQNNP